MLPWERERKRECSCRPALPPASVINSDTVTAAKKEVPPVRRLSWLPPGRHNNFQRCLSSFAFCSIYRVTIQAGPNLLLTWKQKLCVSVKSWYWNATFVFMSTIGLVLPEWSPCNNTLYFCAARSTAPYSCRSLPPSWQISMQFLAYKLKVLDFLSTLKCAQEMDFLPKYPGRLRQKLDTAD